MNASLSDIRDAAQLAREDRDECLRSLRFVIVETGHMPTIELFSRLVGDVHELDLLAKREAAILANGRDLHPEPVPMQVTAIDTLQSDSTWPVNVTFGIPGESSADDPTLTLHEGKPLHSLPALGDVLLVQPPHVIRALKEGENPQA